MIIIDGFRMKHYVELANSTLDARHEQCIQLYDIYQFWYIPFGIFGFHHLYMRNYWKFFGYFFSFGILCFGWLSDITRIYNYYYPQIQLHRKKPFWRFTGYHQKNINEMWLTWVPFSGVLGIHQFYGGDIYLGLCYILSFGLFGIGWLRDMFRINNYIERYNDNIEQQISQIKGNVNANLDSMEEKKRRNYNRKRNNW